MKRTALLLLISMSAVFSIAAGEVTDTLSADRGHRKLRELEVIGVKQMPVADMSPVTRISPAMVRRYNIYDAKDISEIAPNIYMPDYGSRMTSTIYARGLGARIDQPVVGLSIDNVPVLNKDAYDFDMADIESVEVLRGAQAVLNGRNTMGGQINILTMSPRRWQGLRLMAQYGRANTAKVSAGWYHKFSDAWAASLTGLFSTSDGFFRNDYNGSRLDRERSGSVRLKAEWHPSSWLSVSNVASVSVNRQGGYPYESLATGRIAFNDTCFYHRTTFADGLTVAWAGKRVVVTSVTSAQYIDDNMTLDQDFLPEDYFTLTQKRREWALTEDLFTKGSRGAYDWLGGVFAFYKTGDMEAPVTFGDTGIKKLIEDRRNSINPYYPIAWDSRSFVLGSEFTPVSRGFALYHQSDYSLGDWEFQAGLRWDFERVSLDYHSFCQTGFTTMRLGEDGVLSPYGHSAVDINDKGDIAHNYNELLPKLSVGRRLPFGRAYITVSKAYKAGGYNTQMFSDVLQQRLMQFMGLSPNYGLDEIVSYKPEKSWNYEIGLKTSWLNGRLTADFAAFFIDCRDQQLTMFPPGTVTGRVMTNAGRTFSRGFELSAFYEPVDNLSFRASYGYTHATFRRFADSRNDYAGKRLPYAPANTLFVSADWRMPVTIFKEVAPSASVSVRGAGDIYWDELNTIRQPFYALLGASVSFSAPRWSLKLWGENLTSTRYNTFYFVSIGNAFVQRARPWQIGATLRVTLDNL